MVRSVLVSAALAVSAVATAPFLSAQDDSPASAVNKLGVDLDARSDMAILLDEILAGTVILPDLTSPVTSLDVVPEIQFRGDNVQANVPSGDYVQQFQVSAPSCMPPKVRFPLRRAETT